MLRLRVLLDGQAQLFNGPLGPVMPLAGRDSSEP